VAFYICAELSRPALHSCEFGSEPRTGPQQPLRVFAYHILKSAFADAAHGERQEAAHALRYLRQRSNWTSIPLSVRLERWGAPSPPREVRLEYVLSADWALEILCWPRSVLSDGLPIGRESTRDTFHWGQYGGLSNWREWRTQRKLAQQARESARIARERQHQARMQARRKARQLTEATIVTARNETLKCCFINELGSFHGTFGSGNFRVPRRARLMAINSLWLTPNRAKAGLKRCKSKLKLFPNVPTPSGGAVRSSGFTSLFSGESSF